MTANAGGTTEEQVAFIAGHIMDKQTMQAAMQEAVASGIKAAVSDPALWEAAGEAMRQRAVTTTGGWVISWVKAAFSKIGLVLMLLIGLALVGGWPGFVAGVKAIIGGHAP